MLGSVSPMTAVGRLQPAHMHPNDDNVTVLSGMFNIAMRDKT